MSIQETVQSPVNVSTKRTAVNITVVTAIVGVISRVIGVEINISETDVLLFAPVLGIIGGVGYRLSRAITNKWPSVGWVIFGSGKEPVGLTKIGD